MRSLFLNSNKICFSTLSPHGLNFCDFSIKSFAQDNKSSSSSRSADLKERIKEVRIISVGYVVEIMRKKWMWQKRTKAG